ncbi:hypothetical protein FO519_004152 [Halicephalobus sp. NKZ332]|nr:hypothetical protein FO519_004152 [Halicephalobus sp. NKZ332]
MIDPFGGMNLDRQVTKYGGLQTKVRKKGGTLIRKKKFVYDEEQWVALCVHNQQIPFLEWYPTAAEIRKHEPTKVQDLLDCLFVHLSIGDDRCFVIGFADENRPVIEFAARTTEDAKSWIEEITSCLRKLNCLSDRDNEYQSMPIQQYPEREEEIGAGLIKAPPPRTSPQITPRDRRLNLTDEIPLPSSTAPVLPPRPAVMLNDQQTFSNIPDQSPPSSPPVSPSTQRAILCSPKRISNLPSLPDPSSKVLPPKLPPRKIPDLTTPLPMSPTTPNTKMPNGHHQYDFPLTPPTGPRQSEAQYDLCPTPNGTSAPTTTGMVYSKFAFGPENEIALSQEMIQLRMSSASSSTTEDSHESTKSHPGEYTLLTPPPRPPKNLALSSGSLNYAGSFRESRTPARTISLLLTICVEHLALVEVAGNVWIGGWSEEQNATLTNLIHFGDQLVEVNGKQIPIKLRSMPHGSTYVVKKPHDLYTPRSFGIIFHNRKNRIDEIVPLSRAAKAGIPGKMGPFLYGRSEVASVVTEMDGVPLNPFAINEQFYRRVEKVPNGAEIKLVIQPHDFVKLVKKQLKTMKNMKKFVHEN